MTDNIDEVPSAEKAEQTVPWYKPRIWWVYIPLGIFAVIILAFNIIQPITVLPRADLAPGYLLYNQDNEQVTSESFRGQLTMYTFSYTNCGDSCSQTLDNIDAVRTTIKESIPSDTELAFVTISLDPERDTPEQLKASLDEYNLADTVDWQFLVGDPLKTKYAVGSGFGFYYGPREQEDGDYLVTFQPRYILVDGWGVIRAQYGVSAPDTDIIIRDINLVVEETRNSEGVASLAYDAAHLFLCYP